VRLLLLSCLCLLLQIPMAQASLYLCTVLGAASVGLYDDGKPRIWTESELAGIAGTTKYLIDTATGDFRITADDKPAKRWTTYSDHRIFIAVSPWDVVRSASIIAIHMKLDPILFQLSSAELVVTGTCELL
jgi:hypothetical protein